MKKLVSIVAAIILGCGFAHADLCDELLREGQTQYNTGNYRRALEYFDFARARGCYGAQSWIDKCNANLRRTATTATTATTTTTASLPAIDMVYVQGGSFTMGAMRERDGMGDGDELPTHLVSLPDFYIGKYEITQAQWIAVMGSNPSNISGDDLPVENVSWNDVREFIVQLNKATGRQYRLPTEAEWEYAARGGKKSLGYRYAGSNNVDDVAWHEGNSGGKTHPVGTKQPNELDIYDMSGNVWEWCSDWFNNNYYKNSPEMSPTGPVSGAIRVFRGGSWYYFVSCCRVADRVAYSPDICDCGLGFRVVLDQKDNEWP
ncbi:hypothetical protein FACS1894159_04910 [Bacteroidia bacterium]|nr:hypothetical protein FACS1894159_04910 [Bacteroidia bacterium]